MPDHEKTSSSAAPGSVSDQNGEEAEPGMTDDRDEPRDTGTDEDPKQTRPAEARDRRQPTSEDADEGKPPDDISAAQIA